MRMMKVNIDSKTRRIALYLGVVLTVVLILNQGLQFYINASDTFKASMASVEEETLDVSIRTSIGRPSFLEHLLYRLRELTATWYVGGAAKTYAETGLEVTVTGSNVASQASVDYYIEAKASDASGSPYRFLEGTDVPVAVGGAALDLDNQTSITAHLTAMGLSTTQSHTIDYYVYVQAEATGAISGESLTTEVAYTKFDSVTYEYGTIVTDTHDIDSTADDGYVRDEPEYWRKDGDTLTVGDATPTYYDYHAWMSWYSIGLDQGTDLIWARIDWRAYGGNAGPTMVIVGHDSDSPSAPTSYAAYISKPLTTATANWTPSSWNQYQWYSGYCTAVVQEVIDRPGWNGERLTLFVKDDAPGWEGSDDRLYAYSRDFGMDEGPKLKLRYMTYGASWYNIPPLSVVDLPVTMDVVAVLAVIVTSAIIIVSSKQKGGMNKWRK